MTRKDYELIATSLDNARAATIRRTPQAYLERQGALQALNIAATQLCHTLAAGNPRFDSTRFFAAATEGPAAAEALNAEALARELGPAASSK